MTVYWGPNSHLSGEWNIFMPFLFVGQFLLASHGIFIPLLFFANFFFHIFMAQIARRKRSSKKSERRKNKFPQTKCVCGV